MTYPFPQGGYNPQDPYNQGHGGYQQNPYQQGYPQSGGFPAQGGGYPPQPPPKSNTTLIVSIVAVVVLAIGALGVTGFVAPGFFLADDKKDSEGDGKSGGGTGPEALAQAIVAGLNAKDAAALTALKCPDAEDDVSQVIGRVQQVLSAQLSGPVQTMGEAQATAQVTV
ncbi:MAG: hypothetical protein ACRDQB_09610, partial [Thermocrispum sp.]